MDSFRNKVVIVTGASSGMGEVTAIEFSKRGASLVLTGRDGIKLEEVAEVCKEKGADEVLTVLAEFEKLSEVENIVDETVKKFGKIDVLVNNAGVLRPVYLEEVKMVDFDWIFQVNVKATLHLTQQAMPYLVKTKGNVVNVSSVCSVCQFPAILVYNMAKAALDQFTKTIALEYASKGVRVNSVNPSTVATDIQRNRGWSPEQIEQYFKRAATVHPIGRVGTSEDVANAILFLASDSSGWTTGQCLLLDGGRSLTVNQ